MGSRGWGLALPRSAAISAWRVWPTLGVVLIWGFLGVFLLYPLARIFYDAVTDDAGGVTLGHFHAFFTDGYYLRSLWNSLVLGHGAAGGIEAPDLRNGEGLVGDVGHGRATP